MTKESIYYMDDNAFDRFYKRARYQANSFVAGKFGSGRLSDDAAGLCLPYLQAHARPRRAVEPQA